MCTAPAAASVLRRASLSHACACAPQALYVLYRVWYLWDSFSRGHMGGFGATLLAYLALYFFLKLSATPKYAPLAQGGGLVSAGSDLDQKGVIECAAARTQALPRLPQRRELLRTTADANARTARSAHSPLACRSLGLAGSSKVQRTLLHTCHKGSHPHPPTHPPHARRYTWDLLYVTMFVQLTTGFLSDWFWLFSAVPPSIGVYYLWTSVIYPWISKPDPEPMQQMEETRGGKRSKFAKAR